MISISVSTAVREPHRMRPMADPRTSRWASLKYPLKLRGLMSSMKGEGLDIEDL